MHGTIRKAACEACGAAADHAAFVAAVRANVKDLYGVDPAAPSESRPVPCGACGASALKPTTVLFGGMLPGAFFERKVRARDLITA